ncbi:Icc-related predicted phosphoesterase [Anseongella ginsenosidimutans]|uniref:Icc-related predicted phosphoesterase n=1 Tax=Anseongella ginsenosidimutans TaxID=496056 RepID=A0A4R3KQV2_9SPHI|nr:metallophosphoesterase [Anseongella ginsenosidimutans]QEC52915.1 metallophosphoesterase [Anseongella ginsenosidimutans]TCS87308.1 Icc-related predicted phosphoesterase [Anseongella ginsenosidimutans]
MARKNKVRIAAMADIHVRHTDQGLWKAHFEMLSTQADVLLICGDLTDTGRADEARVLADELEACSIPVIGVLGNHDCESGIQDEVIDILNKEQVHILDGESVIIHDIGFAGVKGFGGGFGQHMLPMWGEQMNKDYIQVSVNEAMRLDRALVRLESKSSGLKKIVLLHYSPIPETVKGEPEQIFPFLGSSHLAEPLEHRQVTAVFHGHAHLGTLEGATAGGIPVYNVSQALLLKEGFSPPFYLFETEP